MYKPAINNSNNNNSNSSSNSNKLVEYQLEALSSFLPQLLNNSKLLNNHQSNLNSQQWWANQLLKLRSWDHQD